KRPEQAKPRHVLISPELGSRAFRRHPAWFSDGAAAGGSVSISCAIADSVEIAGLPHARAAFLNGVERRRKKLSELARHRCHGGPLRPRPACPARHAQCKPTGA